MHGEFAKTNPVPFGPKISVGIIDKVSEVNGALAGEYEVKGLDTVRGKLAATVSADSIMLSDEAGHAVIGAPEISLEAQDNRCSFTLHNVTIGNNFHWEREEDQTFRGDLVLLLRPDKVICVINRIHLEDYLESVVSSEMNGNSPFEFLLAHAILSRSWLLSALRRKQHPAEQPQTLNNTGGVQEIVRWYEQDDHELYDVCADDHCQRYQGISKILSSKATEAVHQTRGQVLMYNGQVCDARFSKSCGGITERFATAWGTADIRYLQSVSDASVEYKSVRSEEEAVQWTRSEPQAYCNTTDYGLIEAILPHFDRETRNWFRWKVEYTREELERIVYEKSGLDFGKLLRISPLSRGPSGRIYRLEIAGSKKTIIIGKELEIRRWLSPSHLYSSAFTVGTENDESGDVARFIFHGAGWGHGVGLCQIGAAVMASRGFRAEEILTHYFQGACVNKIY